VTLREELAELMAERDRIEAELNDMSAVGAERKSRMRRWKSPDRTSRRRIGGASRFLAGMASG
jgi:hypothetical protein